MNRKRVCDFLLVRHSNLSLALHRFRDIAGFLLLTPPLFHPNFWGVSAGPDCPCWDQPEPKHYANQPWNYFQSILTCVKIIPERKGQTDGRSDGRTTYYGITALCVASRGKKYFATG